MINLFVVGREGYTDEPIAIFDNWEVAFTIARRVWPDASGEVIASRVHTVPFFGSITNEPEEDEE